MAIVYLYAPEVLWLIDEGDKPTPQITLQDNIKVANQILDICQQYNWDCYAGDNDGVLMATFSQCKNNIYQGGFTQISEETIHAWLERLNKKNDSTELNSYLTVSLLNAKAQPNFGQKKIFCLFLINNNQKWQIVMIQPTQHELYEKIKIGTSIANQPLDSIKTNELLKLALAQLD